VNTTSTSYVTLGSGTPATPSIDLVAGQTVKVTISARMSNSVGAGFAAVMSFAVSGAETIAASDANAVEQDDLIGSTLQRTSLHTASVSGGRAFTMNYKVINACTGTYVLRRIIVG
jgi:hypothetical protein